MTALLAICGPRTRAALDTALVIAKFTSTIDVTKLSCRAFQNTKTVIEIVFAFVAISGTGPRATPLTIAATRQARLQKQVGSDFARGARFAVEFGFTRTFSTGT
jgi:hypothetical protein